MSRSVINHTPKDTGVARPRTSEAALQSKIGSGAPGRPGGSGDLALNVGDRGVDQGVGAGVVELLGD